MNTIAIFAIPTVISIIVLWGLINDVKLFDTFIVGAKEGMQSCISIMPSLIGLICAVSMLKASGALDIFTNIVSPVANFIGIPPEVTPLALLRPISGSGSIALLDNILSTYGPDSFIGRAAAVISGSTETTFYTIAVYFGAVGIKNSRHTIPSALLADFTAIIMAVLMVKKFML